MPTGEAELDGVPIHRVRFAPLNALSARDALPLLWGVRLDGVPLRGCGVRSGAAARQEVAAGADVLHAHWWMPAGSQLLRDPAGADGPRQRRVNAPRSRTARSLARPLFQRAAVVTTISRVVGGWVQAGAGRFVGADHVHPMPIDSRSRPWTRGGGGGVIIGRR